MNLVGKKSRLEIWNLIAYLIVALYLLFLIFPLFKILRSSFDMPDGTRGLGNFKRFFSEPYYFKTIINSFQVSVVVTFFSVILGVPLAYFYNMYQMKGKSFLQVVIILCSMSAPFIGAYSWILVLGRNGVITNFLESIFGFTMPNIYGFKGIVISLTSRLFPMVFLYTSGALKSIDNSLIEASQNLGTKGVRMFFKVIVPLCMPSILAASLIVFMRAIADFGTPLMIGEGFRTFPVEIYNAYVGEVGQNFGFAASISIVAILITAIVFLVQKWATSKFSFTINAMNTIEAKKVKPVFSVFIHFYAYLLVCIAMLPQVFLWYTSFKNTSRSGNVFIDGHSLMSYKEIMKRGLGTSISNTFLVGFVSVAIILVLAVVVSYLVVRRKSFKSQVIDTMSMIPYVLPGSVVGIALISSFNTKPMVLTGTVAIIVISMVIRRIPYTIRSSVAILGQIPISMEEAAISLGSSKLKTFFGITVPMMRNGIISGALLSWVTIITELSTSIILYTTRSQTLTVFTYVFVSRGSVGQAAAVATILSIFTIISLSAFMLISKDKNVAL
jgi:iron(III) transport system permease protein